MNLNDPQYADMSVQDLIDEGLVGPEDVWTNMVGETMIMPIDTIEFLSEISDLDEDLTDEQLELFYSVTEGNA